MLTKDRARNVLSSATRANTGGDIAENRSLTDDDNDDNGDARTQSAVSQVSSRVLTFILNILAVRQLPPEVYGIAVVQFHLITTSILTFSREGVRRACLRGVKLGWV